MNSKFILFLILFIFVLFGLAKGPLAADSSAGVTISLDLNTAVILVDLGTEIFWSQSQAADVVYNRVSNYMKENTYNQVSLSGGLADVYGYYQIAKTCDPVGMSTAAKNAAVAAGVDLNKYNLVIVIGNFRCGLNGAYNLGMGNSILAILDERTIAHELMHLLGFKEHANFYNCGSQAIGPAAACAFSEYGDPYSILGSPSGLVHTSAFYKTSFLKPSNITNVCVSGNYFISPIEIDTDLPQVLRIPLSNQNLTVFHNLYIEYRRHIGFDNLLYSFMDKGALLHLDNYLIDASPTVPSSESNPILNAGQTFVYPDVAEIKAIAADENSLELNIHILSNGAPCIQKISPLSAARGSVVTITGANFGASPDLKYNPYADANNDGYINSLDLVALRNAYMSKVGDANYNSYIDVNHDGYINALDLVGIRNGFMSSRGNSYVQFGADGYAKIISWSGTEIICEVPYRPAPGSVAVAVTSGGITNDVIGFTVEP